MSATLEIDHKHMHDIKSAAESAGYSRDHVASLARAGKIVAAQIGRQWYIDLDSLKQYAHITALEQQVKQKHLSHERKSTKEFNDALKSRRTKKSARLESYQKNLHTSLASFLLVFVLMGGMLGILAPTFFAGSTSQTASLPGVSSAVLPTDEIASLETVAEGDTTFGDGTVTVEALADEEEAIVLLPDSMAETLQVFSDPVTLVETESGVELRLVGETERAIGAVVVPIREAPVP